MVKPASGGASCRVAGDKASTLVRARSSPDRSPGASLLALRQLERVQGGMGVMTVALEHAAAPEFSNDGAALILRMLRQESAIALAVLASDMSPRSPNRTV